MRISDSNCSCVFFIVPAHAGQPVRHNTAFGDVAQTYPHFLHLKSIDVLLFLYSESTSIAGFLIRRSSSNSSCVFFRVPAHLGHPQAYKTFGFLRNSYPHTLHLNKIGMRVFLYSSRTVIVGCLCSIHLTNSGCVFLRMRITSFQDNIWRTRISYAVRYSAQVQTDFSYFHMSPDYIIHLALAGLGALHFGSTCFLTASQPIVVEPSPLRSLAADCPIQ